MITEKEYESIKVGDLIFVHGGFGKCLSGIDKITPKGFIRVGEVLYDKHGYQKGGDIWHKTSLSIAAPDEVKKYREALFVRDVRVKLAKLTANDISYEMAVSLNNLLSLGMEEPK